MEGINTTLDHSGNGGGGGGGGEAAKLAVSITYANLKALRDGGNLVPGTWYRITDYACTTTQQDTQSANHAFDIIVRADDESHLNENAYAAHHEGDTYFANCKLEAWQLKYCLDNDIRRFAWADDENGKGVVYLMKDEWNNECPYDFKNIMFKRWQVFDASSSGVLSELNEKFLSWEDSQGSEHPHDLDINDEVAPVWCYTFPLLPLDHNVEDVEEPEELGYDYEHIQDASLNLSRLDPKGGYYINPVCRCELNKVEMYELGVTIDGTVMVQQHLNNIVVYSIEKCVPEDYEDKSTWFFETKSSAYNRFGMACRNITIFAASNVEIGGAGKSIVIGKDCGNIKMGDNNKFVSFGSDIYNVQFGSNIGDISFGSNIEGVSFGSGYRNITVFEGVTCCMLPDTAGAGNSTQNAQILNGTGTGYTSANKLVIQFAPNKNYTQIAGMTTNGNLAIWNPADNA